MVILILKLISVSDLLFQTHFSKKISVSLNALGHIIIWTALIPCLCWIICICVLENANALKCKVLLFFRSKCLQVALQALGDDLASQLVVSGGLVSANQNTLLNQQCCFMGRSFLLLFIQKASKLSKPKWTNPAVTHPRSRGRDGNGPGCRGGIGSVAPSL